MDLGMEVKIMKRTDRKLSPILMRNRDTSRCLKNHGRNYKFINSVMENPMTKNFTRSPVRDSSQLYSVKSLRPKHLCVKKIFSVRCLVAINTLRG